ncbi:MAG: pentapeptide repeat-containing protein [Cyclobacteriaceae bacterium]|nr:pentapeptide repeat-containing protein [Cyclobacteriaceae bacterium]
MNPVYEEGKAFNKTNYQENPLPKGEYENCTFTNCDLSNTDLADIKFVDCSFTGCNLSLAKLVNSAWRSVAFKDCKMLGLHFEKCHELGFSVSFQNCNVSQSSFYQVKLKKTIFQKSQLHEVDFAECDLTGASFDQCDLLQALFENTILEKTDFRTAFHFSIDPSNNRMKKARFTLSGLPGLLSKYDIDVEG